MSYTIVDLEQGTDEWLEWRRGKLCSSDMAALLGYNAFGRSLKRWHREKINHPLAGFDAIAMKRGRDREKEARKMFEAMLGAPCMNPVIASNLTPWAGASLDVLNEDLRIGGEIKCPTNPEVHLKAISGLVPDYYMPQLQWSMYCTGFDSWEYISFCPENHDHPYVQFKVARNEFMIEEMLDKGKWFMDCLRDGVNPVDEVFIEDKVRFDKVEELENLLNQRDFCENKIKELKEDLTSTFDLPRARGGNLLFTYETVGGRVDYDKLLKDSFPSEQIEEKKKMYKKSDSFTWKVRRV